MNMANKIIGGKVSAAGRTEFQLHVSQFQSYRMNSFRLFDFTEARLKQYLESIDDPQRKIIVAAVLEDYKTGKIAVAWKEGEPVYVRMTKIV